MPSLRSTQAGAPVAKSPQQSVPMFTMVAVLVIIMAVDGWLSRARQVSVVDAMQLESWHVMVVQAMEPEVLQ